MAWNGTHLYEVNETAVTDDNVTLVLEFGPTELRKNPYYIRIYIQYMNIIFNQIGPFLLLGVLNFKGEWIIELFYYYIVRKSEVSDMQCNS